MVDASYAPPHEQRRNVHAVMITHGSNLLLWESASISRRVLLRQNSLDRQRGCREELYGTPRDVGEADRGQDHERGQQGSSGHLHDGDWTMANSALTPTCGKDPGVVVNARGGLVLATYPGRLAHCGRHGEGTAGASLSAL